ncbi:MAG: hypothetical protein VKN56_08480 [Cyanobacteriota bacterium]|nr:hypothetical protein [Cyanobacteriota bacterium]
MRRVMVAVWGADGKAYVGRSMTLFRDPEVSYGGIKVGGVRISHMSHMDAPMAISLAEKRGKKTEFQVEPLIAAADPLEETKQQLEQAAQSGMAQLEEAWKALPNATRKQLAGDWWEALKASTASTATTPDPRVKISGGQITVQTTDPAQQTMADYLEAPDEN